MLQKINFYLLLFCLSSLTSLFFIDNGHDILEIIFKLLSIISLLFFYVTKTKKINIWYVLILIFSCFYTFFLVYDIDFLAAGVFFMILNRVIYVVIAQQSTVKTNYKRLVIYLLTFLIPVAIIFPQLNSYLRELSYPILAIGLLSALMCSLAFANYLKKMNPRNRFFLFGLLLLLLADVLISFNRFIDYKFYRVIIYTFMYHVSRYLICIAMIIKRT